MADNTNPTNPADQTGSEASAGDLMSLWGASKPAKPPAIPPAQETSPIPPPPPPMPPRETPVPKPPPVAPAPVVPQKPPEPIKPKAAPIPKEPPKPAEPKAKTEVLEGELVDGPQPKKKPAEPEAPPQSEVEFLPEKEGFAEQLDEFLAELNISKENILYGIGCLVLIIVVIFSGIYGFRYYKNKKAEAPPPVELVSEEQRPPTEIAREETGVPSVEEIGKIEILPGSFVLNSGVGATVAVGTEPEKPAEVENYIMFFKRIQNAYETDIDELLSKSVDRRGRLQSHIVLLKDLHEKGIEMYEKITAEMDDIEKQYDARVEKQIAYDSIFFEQLNMFNAGNAEEALNAFIGISRDIVQLRAKFKARQKIKLFYEQAIPKLKRRIEDIELNSEPLIKGIKVYDVKGSDVKLIVPVESEESASGGGGETLSYPAFPLLPINVPAGQRDFVTSP